MIEATIKKVYGERATVTRALTGTRCTFSCFTKRTFPPDSYDVRIAGIVRTKKGSRIRKELYRGLWLSVVGLEDIVVDEYEED